MNIKQSILEIKNFFYYELKTQYSKPEIEQLFYALCAHYLDLTRIEIALEPNKEISIDKLLKALSQLKENTPLQYIIGETEFYSLPFKVSKDTLIPRPETEELVDWIVTDFKNNSSISILDIGTGSGCIAICLAKNLVNSNVTALDYSINALEIAQSNAQLNKTVITFIEQDILNTENFYFEKKLNVIVSNPPYVRELEKKMMQDNVLSFEPHSALFVEDSNALIFYEAITKFALNNLKSNGILYFEINEYLGKETVELLKNYGFSRVELRKDIFGKDRMIKAILIPN